MEENNKVEVDLEVKKQEAKQEVSGLLGGVKEFLIDLLDIKNDTNKEGTVQTIKDNISMKGHTAWILVFSIVIASIGLNANSTAVVIGAMLISPLMGPILGVGLSIGINDIDTLRRSMINLGVMVGLSLLTSFLFFLLPLFHDPTTEILARTRPDVRDVFIALAGGLALIVAMSRPKPQTNTVAGVAIATALMPPLCTAGYGLATWQLNYFFGAMFLFTINTIFIALSTFVIVKFLRFPMVKYINSAKRKRIGQFASIVAFIILAGSIYSFYNLFKENEFKKTAQSFIAELKKDGVSIIGEDDKNIDYINRKITLPLFNSVSENQVGLWEERLIELGLNDVELHVQQQDDTEMIAQVKTLQDLYAQNQKIITSRDESIKEKEEKIRLLEKELNRFYKDQIPFKSVSEEAKINYSGIEQMSYAKKVVTNFSKIDSVAFFSIKWKQGLDKKELNQQEQKLKLWLKTRLALDTLKLVRE
ncbi:TIGR00341 family protein [Aureibaculum marinum]|uniref:TIGR00341 family protein n=1 Tax=Aureibaculum marinum TaxID=2487930 RepID=A0A3N4PK00_9FLAO|nr:TIGR00341 family protein [Aureibaculum marinum]RPD99933.1 TIGR00341 family protein [Aureibaculum marinum]